MEQLHLTYGSTLPYSFVVDTQYCRTTSLHNAFLSCAVNISPPLHFTSVRYVGVCLCARVSIVL